MYFAITSLSTIGFGDLVPRSDLERALGAILLLTGVAIFTYVMGSFIDMLNEINGFNSEYNDGDQLAKFFGALRYLNKERDIKLDLKREIEDFFAYSWIQDRNLAFKSSEDLQFFEELP
jgi:hypothetical protein